MDVERSRRAYRIFKDAVEREPHEREAFLDEACADDPSIRKDVEALIRSHEAAGSFLKSPAVEEATVPVHALAAGQFAGRTLGPYQVKTLLGSGGMGEVYLAEDRRLGRNVALKLLAPAFLSDRRLRVRFLQEARAVSILNHPNICTLYDIGRQDGIDFIVMEYLEGQTLADRLRSGPLRLDQAMRVGIEIADALDKAHCEGITHRDLKPSNIMLTKSGTKLLDFGLAKQAMVRDEASNATDLTSKGIILGTLQYMAPEQLEGKQADARTDIFAFGSVLYEMITCQKAFQGTTEASLMAAILEHEPSPPSLLQAMTPPSLDRIVKVCLAKDPEDRWQTARDMCRELKWVQEGRATPKNVRAEKPNHRASIVFGLSAILILAAVLLLVRYFRPVPSAPDVRFDIPVPEMQQPNSIAISPDGRRLVYGAIAGKGQFRLWVRSLDSLDPQSLPGTEKAIHPFWSPDGRSIGFASGAELKRIEVSGGLPQTVTHLGGAFFGGTWNRDGVIVFSDGFGRLRFVSASGGEATDITYEDTTRQGARHYWPSFLPDGRHFLFLTWSGKAENQAIYVGSLDSKNRIRLMAGNSMASFSRGFVFYVQERNLMARPFDATRLEFTSDSVRVADEIGYNANTGRSAFAISDQGTLIYRRGLVPSEPRGFVWVDRNGQTIGAAGAVRPSAGLRLSPDGKRIAFSASVGGALEDVWIYDIDRDQARPLTSDPSTDHMPVWSPDGSELVFDSSRLAVPSLEQHALFRKPSNGAVAERLLLAPEQGFGLGAFDWSLDGRLLFEKREKGTGRLSLWVLPLSGDRKPFPYLTVPFIAVEDARISPNGRWVAYMSNESGTVQVIVQPFPDPSGGKWQVSGKGGTFAKWRRDGRELYYLDPEGQIIAVPVETEHNFEYGRPTPLFKTPGPNTPYEITPDGQRFLVLADAAAVNTAPPPITVVLNWSSTLKR